MVEARKTSVNEAYGRAAASSERVFRRSERSFARSAYAGSSDNIRRTVTSVWSAIIPVKADISSAVDAMKAFALKMPFMAFSFAKRFFLTASAV